MGMEDELSGIGGAQSKATTESLHPWVQPESKNDPSLHESTPSSHTPSLPGHSSLHGAHEVSHEADDLHSQDGSHMTDLTDEYQHHTPNSERAGSVASSTHTHSAEPFAQAGRPSHHPASSSNSVDRHPHQTKPDPVKYAAMFGRGSTFPDPHPQPAQPYVHQTREPAAPPAQGRPPAPSRWQTATSKLKTTSRTIGVARNWAAQAKLGDEEWQRKWMEKKQKVASPRPLCVS